MKFWKDQNLLLQTKEKVAVLNTILSPKKTLKGGQKGPFLEDFRKNYAMIVLNQIFVMN